MQTKKTHRKVVAVALGVLGVSGLSLASASTLNVNAGSNIQAGVDTVAACQGTTPVAATFGVPTLTSGAYKTTGVTLSGIVTACAGKSLKVAFLDSTGTVSVESTVVTLPSTGSPTLAAQVVTVGAGMDSAALSKVAVTIFG
jgi:hypothetical protein